MKRIFVLTLLVALGIYGTAAVKLSESGANRFLAELEELSLNGESDEYCARLHPDLKASIHDRSAPAMPRDIEGGYEEFCDFIREAAKGMALLGPETQATREDFEVTRSWLHPWTARVSYHETRTTNMTRVNVTLNTVSDDRWTLVYGFDGIKVLALDSDVRLAD